jgi:hypothetical protein
MAFRICTFDFDSRPFSNACLVFPNPNPARLGTFSFSCVFVWRVVGVDQNLRTVHVFTSLVVYVLETFDIHFTSSIVGLWQMGKY